MRVVILDSGAFTFLQKNDITWIGEDEILTMCNIERY